jgi:RES domain-containing protein
MMAFSGEGAMRFGGRWNTPGRRIVYTAGSQSLVILEILAHLEDLELLHRYSLFAVQFDAADVEKIAPGALKNWWSYPPPRKVQEFGDGWVVRAAAPVLRVPSAIVPAESNYLLNPSLAGFARLAISGAIAYRFDSR